jgi:4-amino-4-deoxy-L-arabinose transferase-like glycosyltransferase
VAGWRLVRIDLVLMAAITAWALFRLAPDLSHPSIWSFDESFHQVVTRHVYDHPLTPTLIEDPLHGPRDFSNYWESRVWLIKPPGAFWFGALMMLLTGKVPLAFRLGGLLSQIFSALILYWLSAPVTRRAWAFLASLGFTSLPIGWIYTQARFVGDELDLVLCACICAAMACLFVAVERRSTGWAALAGAATGLGILVKSFLALTPLGVAACLWLLAKARFSKGPRAVALGVMVAMSVAIAAPWNLYAAAKWPAEFRGASTDVFSHLNKPSQWHRPVDAVFNELNQSLFDPLPQALALAIGVWLAVRAVRKREPVVIGAALWLWATWLGHSFPNTKMHSHLWNSMVPAFLGVAVVLDDVWTSKPLALGLGAGLAIPPLLALFPSLERLRNLAPQVFEQTRRIPGLAEGVCLIAAAALLGWLVEWLLRRFRLFLPTGVLAVAPAVCLLYMTVWKASSRQKELDEDARAGYPIAYSREAGRAIDALTPKKSVIVLDVDLQPPGQIERHNLTFWSDRLVIDGRDPSEYVRAGFHPYLVSPGAEPYVPLEVPADGWLRAYDLAAPAASPPPLPAGVHSLDVRVGNLHVLGFASAESTREVARYAFYVRPDGGPPGPLSLSFETARGREVRVIPPESSLRMRGRLAGAAWFVVPALGPPLQEVQAIIFGAEPGQRVLLGPPR